MAMSGIVERLRALTGQRLTYHEGAEVRSRPFPLLGEDVKRVAAHLRKCGVSRGVRVGINAHNSYPWVVYDLALVELGAVCVALPMDHFAETPFDELARRFGVRLLLVGKDSPRPRQPWVVSLQVASPEACQLAASSKDHAHPDDPALFSLVFSSGTSGRLKCLKIGHRGVEAVVRSFAKDFQFRPDDCILAFLPLSSFQQRWMLYAAIHYGFNIALTVATRLFQALRDMRPTVIGAAPLLYETVEARYQALPTDKRRALDALRATLRCLPVAMRRRLGRRVFRSIHEVFGGNIRFALAGAAPIRIKTLRFFDSIGMPLYSAYGLTEVGFLSWNVPGKVRLGSVGKAVYPGSLEVAADGELIFSHPDLLSYGYLEVDAEEERKTFLSPSRVATGDIGHFDANGYLYIDGRKKDIIITQGGYKIQPEDLERAIEENPKVGRAVVFGGGEMACVTALVSLLDCADRRLQTVIEADIDALNRRLPMPSRINKVVFTSQQFTMESGLLNHNLKVDRRKVLARFQSELVPAVRMMSK